MASGEGCFFDVSLKLKQRRQVGICIYGFVFQRRVSDVNMGDISTNMEFKSWSG